MTSKDNNNTYPKHCVFTRCALRIFTVPRTNEAPGHLPIALHLNLHPYEYGMQGGIANDETPLPSTTPSFFLFVIQTTNNLRQNRN